MVHCYLQCSPVDCHIHYASHHPHFVLWGKYCHFSPSHHLNVPSNVSHVFGCMLCVVRAFCSSPLVLLAETCPLNAKLPSLFPSHKYCSIVIMMLCMCFVFFVMCACLHDPDEVRLSLLLAANSFICHSILPQPSIFSLYCSCRSYREIKRILLRIIVLNIYFVMGLQSLILCIIVY